MSKYGEEVISSYFRWGDRSAEHSTNPLPYSTSLAKKKKFAKNRDKKEAAIRFCPFVILRKILYYLKKTWNLRYIGKEH